MSLSVDLDHFDQITHIIGLVDFFECGRILSQRHDLVVFAMDDQHGYACLSKFVCSLDRIELCLLRLKLLS